MRNVTKMFTVAATIWAGIVIGLMGCDRSLTAPDPISPKADLQVIQVQVGALNLATLTLQTSSAAGGTGNVSVSAADFPEPTFRLRIFNAIPVELRDYRIDYFAEDGVTPLGTRPFAGALHQFIDAGNMVEGGLTSIAPGTAVPPATPIVAGVPGEASVRLRVVSDELRSFLAGPDNVFRLNSEDTGSNDDFRGTVIARVAIRGADINGNFVEARANLTIVPSALVTVGTAPQ